MKYSFLPQNEKLFYNAFHYAAIGMALVGSDGAWLAVNKALCDITGYSEEELLQRTFQDITHPDDLDDDMELVRQVLSGKIDTYRTEKRYLHKDGSIIHILLNVSLVTDNSGAPLHFISQIQDITEQKHLEDELIRQATEDILTGVSNRRHFYDLAQRELIRGTRYTDPSVVLMLDLDHFKEINDTFGHGTGDIVLKKAAETCKNGLRSIDIFGRIGGEEFCAFLVKTDSATGFRIAERLRKAVEQLVLPTEKGLVKLTVSIGGIAFTGADEPLEHRIKQADEHLYSAKSGGRNKVILYEDIKEKEKQQTPGGFVRLEWVRSYESGHALIDEQHLQLFGRANVLFDALLARKDRAFCQKCIDRLIADTITHFEYEESILKELGYPDLHVHEAIHRQLAEKASHLAKLHKHGKMEITDAFQFLAIELINQHMVVEDRKFFSWMTDVK